VSSSCGPRSGQPVAALRRNITLALRHLAGAAALLLLLRGGRRRRAGGTLDGKGGAALNIFTSTYLALTARRATRCGAATNPQADPDNMEAKEFKLGVGSSLRDRVGFAYTGDGSC
jgi:hypothetical protein